MLPKNYQNLVVLKEVPWKTWQEILKLTGDLEKLPEPGSHEALSEHLANSPSEELLHMLDALHVLGSDSGRRLIEEAADTQNLDLNIDDLSESSQELVARLWIESRDDSAINKVLIFAHMSAREAASDRVFREFVSDQKDFTPDLDELQLQEAIAEWCTENRKSLPILIRKYERGELWIFEIIRGDAKKSVVEIRNSEPGLLSYIPMASDVVRYDPKNGKIEIATRSSKLLSVYRQVIGTLVGNNADLFSGENVVSLESLRKEGSSLFEKHQPPEIVRVDVVELRWQRGDRDNIQVHGRDCFKILTDLGARLTEGRLTEAKLSIRFAGVGRSGHVSLKVPSRMVINAGTNEDIVEKFLNDCGIHGSFDDESEQRNFWSLYPWRMSEKEWRANLGSSRFDLLHKAGSFKPISLAQIEHPDHPFNPKALTVESDGRHSVGVSRDSDVPMRELTKSDYLGYEIDMDKCLGNIVTTLNLEGTKNEFVEGLWFLGRRELSSSTTISVFLITREPTNVAVGQSLIVAREGARRCVLLHPTGCLNTYSLSGVQCTIPSVSHENLFREIIETLELQDEVPLPLWRREALLIDSKRGQAWYKGIPLTQLKAGTHPYKFALKVAQAKGQVVTKEALTQYLSPSRDDEKVANIAKKDFVKNALASLVLTDEDGSENIKRMFEPCKGGYRLNGEAYVLS
jgi:hypothetical protein